MMSKKHYICTHTWNDAESRKIVIDQTKGMTDKMFFEALKSEKAETLQHWMGKDDFSLFKASKNILSVIPLVFSITVFLDSGLFQV